MSIVFQKGDVARFIEDNEWRIVRHISFNRKGEQLVGFGIQPIGFYMAKDVVKRGVISHKMDNRLREGFDELSSIISDFETSHSL